MLLAHLRRGRVAVAVGDRIGEGDVVGDCGNSGNNTEPHVHVQATDTTDWERARGLPISFRGAGGPRLPAESEIVIV